MLIARADARTIVMVSIRLLQVRELPLPDNPTTFISRNTFHEASFHEGLQTHDMFHKVSVQGDIVAATIVNMIEGVPNMSSPFKIFVADWKSGVRRIIDSGLPEVGCFYYFSNNYLKTPSYQLTNLIGLRLFPFHLMLVLAKSNRLSIFITSLKACGDVTADVMLMMGQDEHIHARQSQFHRIDAILPDHSEVYISDAINIGPYRPSPSLSVLAIPPWPAKGTHFRFQFVLDHISQDEITHVSQNCGAIRMLHEGYADLVQLGTCGHRAVWLQQPLESDDVHVYRLDYDAASQRLSPVTVLLPPEPGLPFKPRDCRTLAFDEATGRLCVGLYDGSIYVLDYV